MRVFLGFTTALLTAGIVFGSDPFLNKQNAVGYLVVGDGDKKERFVVIEAADGSVRLIKATSREDTRESSLDLKVMEEEENE